MPITFLWRHGAPGITVQLEVNIIVLEEVGHARRYGPPAGAAASLEDSGKDEDIAHEIYHDDAVLEFPQSGERFEGVENFREWRRQYRRSSSSTPDGSLIVLIWSLLRT
ncbi:hypothetical protein [Arthrobacter sp. ov118]|uniref:hypothetical protein n=1 Tax=Arthrobacter sp. ov118 TaxID=1761747 RepID=UPI00116059E8|nr:hypothetical protein [Arthrobacter sp. ov118]